MVKDEATVQAGHVEKSPKEASKPVKEQTDIKQGAYILQPWKMASDLLIKHAGFFP